MSMGQEDIKIPEERRGLNLDCDIYLLLVTWWDVGAGPITGHHHVGLVRRVECFTGAGE